MSSETIPTTDRRSFASQQRRLAAAVGLNALIVVVQVFAGLAAGSLGLLADAGHNLSDTAAVALALVAVRLARRAPSASRTFGGLRWPVLAAQANAASILVVTVVLTVEAVRRLGDNSPVDGPVVVVVALAGAAVNGIAALLVRESHADLNTRAAVLHLVADAAVSVTVAAIGLVIWLTGGWYWLDPAVSLLIGLVIAWQGVRLLTSASRVLLEATPAGLDVERLRAAACGVRGVTGIHDIHVWSLSDTLHAASAHLELAGHPSLEQARTVSDEVKRVLAEDFAISHATLESECDPCGPPAADRCDVRTLTVVAPSRHAH